MKCHFQVVSERWQAPALKPLTTPLTLHYQNDPTKPTTQGPTATAQCGLPIIHCPMSRISRHRSESHQSARRRIDCIREMPPRKDGRSRAQEVERACFYRTLSRTEQIQTRYSVLPSQSFHAWPILMRNYTDSLSKGSITSATNVSCLESQYPHSSLFFRPG